MNVFEFFTKINHPEKKARWVETTAYFTGERRLYHKGRGRGDSHKALYITSATEVYEYAVKYYVEDKERIGWYIFCPVPDPEPEDIAGTSMRIRYKKSRPYLFENMDASQRDVQ